jgi:hypothetical protein
LQDRLGSGDHNGWLRGLFARRQGHAGMTGRAAFEAKRNVLQDKRFALLVYDLNLRPTLQFASQGTLIGYLDGKGDYLSGVHAY